jgi:tetratricopeptide (TPR) repeat protein
MTRAVGSIPQEPVAFQLRPGLLAKLDPTGPGESLVRAIVGMPGVGKTQLAAEYARARLAEGWRLVAWVNAGDAGTLLAGLAAIADAAGLSEACTRREADDLGRAVRHRLETDGDRCLIVFDNASDPGLLRPFIPSGGAQVLITSRELTPDIGTSISVEVFTADEALAFLARRTGLADAAGAAALAAELRQLPIGLAQAAAVIAGQRLAYDAYLERLRTLPVEEYPNQEEGQPYPHGVAEAVQLSVDAVRMADRAGVCTRVMDVMAGLAAAGIRRDLLHSAGRVGLLASGGDRVEADLVDRALEQLADGSLLSFSLDGETIMAHCLVIRTVRDGLARKKRMTAVCRAAALVLEARARALTESRDRPAVRDIPQQVAALSDNVTELLDNTAVPAGEAEELTRVLLRLRSFALRYLIELGENAQQAITVGESLTADLERVLGPDHPDTLTTRNYLAAAYQDAGRAAEAITVLEQVLTARERVLGHDHPDTLTNRNNLAAAYQDAGRATEAITVLEQVLTARERVLGHDHPDTLTNRNNLATAYREVGRAEDAIRLHEQTLVASERVLGHDHPDTVGALYNLALAYWAAGRIAGAVPVFERVLAARERLLGHDHPGTLTSRNNLATAYWAAGRTAEAIPLHEQVLAARERVLGHDHPGTLTSRNNLGAAYRDAGRIAEAISLFEEVLAARERVLGHDHPGTRTTRDNLAIARSKRAKRNRARNTSRLQTTH